jgi:hypothetical protein
MVALGRRATAPGDKDRGRAARFKDPIADDPMGYALSQLFQDCFTYWWGI